METYIAILRGINVSGHKSVKMADLKKSLEELDFKNIRTYIQSGNVIFETKKTKEEELEKKLEKKIEQAFRFEVPVIVRNHTELKKTVENNPFLDKRKEDVTKLHVTFLSQKPDSSLIASLSKNNYAPDEFIVAEKEIFLFCPNGYGNTKLSNTFFENKLKIKATTRNWKTINKLEELCEA